MGIITALVTVLLSLFSTGVMSYIAMATPIGPWIAPTLVLVGTILLSFLPIKNKTTSLALATAGGSIGGILATACGFSFPTVYFLAPSIFDGWLAQPLYFVCIMAGLALAAGSYGLLIANIVEDRLLVQQDMPFPIGQLVYKMIAAGNQARKAMELLVGFVGTTIFGFLQGGFFGLKGILPRSLTLISGRTIGVVQIPAIQIRFDILPMLLAIGFVTGHVIALPLAVGALSKLALIDPINGLLFKHIKPSDFILAFCSGMVLIGAVQSFIDLPKMVRKAIDNYKNGNGINGDGDSLFSDAKKAITIPQVVITFGLIIAFLTYFDFSLLEQLYLLVFTFVCAYQIVVIAGKIGMAQLGRFATFVMVPALFMFGVHPIKLTIIATFVEIAGGVATDILFGRKMGSMAELDRGLLKRSQLLGLLVSALSVGVIFWLLINHFGLGSDDLFAQRSQARALLINVRSFDIYILLLGALYGFILKKCKMSPMLVLGGLLMPINYSLGLIVGGMLTWLVKDREEWEAFWSGVFAANSIWELVKTIL